MNSQVQRRHGPTHRVHLMAIGRGRTVHEAEPRGGRQSLAGDEGDAMPETLATVEGRERVWEASSDGSGGMGARSGARGGR